MYPKNLLSPIDLSLFPECCGVLDIIANPDKTALQLDAEKRGIKFVGGLYMLVAQAVRSGEYFDGVMRDSSTIDKVYSAVLQNTKNIILVGMPSCGKSTVGKHLAEALNRKFIDTDEEIVKRAGKEITEIFAEIGNEGFRKLEAEVIACVSREHQGAVIATGGGAILRDDNVRALKRNGKIYFLNRPLENIVPTADRPLALDRAALEARFRERYARYLSTCDKEIKTAESVSETANMISEDFFQ
jgi:shikimate dehydrogenase